MALEPRGYERRGYTTPMPTYVPPDKEMQTWELGRGAYRVTKGKYSACTSRILALLSLKLLPLMLSFSFFSLQ